MFSFEQIVEKLLQNQVIAYPTEAVFGLGCNPNSEQAVKYLLKLKNRSIEKGLILIAPTIEFFLPYIDQNALTQTEWQRFTHQQDKAITWLLPAHHNVPPYLRGNFQSIALRLCPLPAVEKLCQRVGFPLTSTSANLSGQPPCRTAREVQQQFGQDFPVLNSETGGKQNPSEIRDIFTEHILRKG